MLCPLVPIWCGKLNLSWVASLLNNILLSLIITYPLSPILPVYNYNWSFSVINAPNDIVELPLYSDDILSPYDILFCIISLIDFLFILQLIDFWS